LAKLMPHTLMHEALKQSAERRKPTGSRRSEAFYSGRSGRSFARIGLSSPNRTQGRPQGWESQSQKAQPFQAQGYRTKSCSGSLEQTEVTFPLCDTSACHDGGPYFVPRGEKKICVPSRSRYAEIAEVERESSNLESAFCGHARKTNSAAVSCATGNRPLWTRCGTSQAGNVAQMARNKDSWS